LNIFDLLKFS